MAVLDNILPAVGRISGLSRELYRVAAANHKAARDFVKAASTANSFASTLKQIGTIVKEDDRLPSHEAFEVLEDLIEQSLAIISEIETLVHFADQEHEGVGSDHGLSPARLLYLTNHLEALRATLSVLLQTLNTAQSIVWSKYRPTISQQQAAKAVANERLQLETLITEQQLGILTAVGTHDQTSSSGSLLLMEGDSSQSLVAADRQDGPIPATLHQYQDRYIASLDQTSSSAPQWLLAIRNITTSQSDRLLDRWTCLPQLDARMREEEQQTRTQQRESQQPMVESDDEDDHKNVRSHKMKSSGAPQKMQPLFMEAESISISQEARYGPTAPMSPAASPRTSRNSLAGSSNDPSSPRSSIASLPMEAAAAVEAHEEDEDIDLEIPWQLCTRKHYWRYIDGKVVSSNTDQLPSIAFLERNSSTEIVASWVCKEAIHERGYRAKQVQKERQDGRRTRLITTFIIEQPLQFEQVKQLVERTVDIYRQNRPPSPPPRVRRSSFQRPPPPPPNISRPSEIDRDRTPVPSKTHPPLGVHRPTSSMPIPPQMPPLDRSMSMPGPGFHRGQNPHAPNLQIPMPPSLALNSLPQGPYSPQLYNSPQGMYPPPPPPPSAGLNSSALPPHLQPHNFGSQQSPLRQSYLNPNARGRYDGNITTSDSESDKDRRRRRSKSRNRNSYAADAKKKSHNKKKAAGVLMGVGGLTALLDGLSGL